jgi:hypothetical protein
MKDMRAMIIFSIVQRVLHVSGWWLVNDLLLAILNWLFTNKSSVEWRIVLGACRTVGMGV